VNAATGRTRALGAGNGVVVVRDSVDANLRVQGTATVRVNQIVTRVSNALSIIQIGVGGRGQIAGRAFDRNGYAVSGRTLGYVTRNAQFVTIDANGTVSGVALDSTTYVVDSLLEGTTVYKDSTLVKVVVAPPALLRWGVPNDSLSVGNGSSVSVPLTLSRTDSAPRTVFLTVIPAVDTLVARPATACGGPLLPRLVIPALSSGTSVLVCGLKAGRVVIKAQDSLSVFARFDGRHRVYATTPADARPERERRPEVHIDRVRRGFARHRAQRDGAVVRDAGLEQSREYRI